MTQQRINQINELLKNECFKLSVKEVFKNDKTWTGICLESNQTNCAPIIYDNEIWELSDSELAAYFKEVYRRYSLDGIDTKSVLERDYILNRVLPRVYSDKKRSQIEKAGLVFVTLLDLLVVFYVPVDFLSEDNSQASYNLTKAMLSHSQIDLNELIQAAKTNVKQQYQIIPILDVFDPVVKENLLCESDSEPPILILTNKNWINGAGVIMNEEVFYKIVEKFGSRFFILPSSIHELLCIPYGERSADELLALVRSINSERVKPIDKLSDSVYLYENGKIQVVV